VTREWVDDDEMFILKQSIGGSCQNWAVWMGEDKYTNSFSLVSEVTLKSTWLTNLRVAWLSRQTTENGREETICVKEQRAATGICLEIRGKCG